jgi:hypothetical protein
MNTVTQSRKVWLEPALLFLFILIAAFSRLIPHPYNFSPLGAMGLFGGAYFSRNWQAYLAPLAALFISDLILNNTVYAAFNPGFTLFYDGALYTYGALAITVIIGRFLTGNTKLVPVAVGALAASVIFFIITNAACWPGNTLYTQDFGGFIACMAAGIPFAEGTLAGNLFYAALLFGGFELSVKRGVLARA